MGHFVASVPDDNGDHVEANVYGSGLVLGEPLRGQPPQTSLFRMIHRLGGEPGAGGERREELLAAVVRDPALVERAAAVFDTYGADAWYERPIFYHPSRFSVCGPGAEVRWPAYTERLERVKSGIAVVDLVEH